MEITPEDFLQATGVDSNSCGFGSGYTAYDERGMCEQHIDTICKETTETPTDAGIDKYDYFENICVALRKKSE